MAWLSAHPAQQGYSQISGVLIVWDSMGGPLYEQELWVRCVNHASIQKERQEKYKENDIQMRETMRELSIRIA
jgi:hypothetical protein